MKNLKSFPEQMNTRYNITCSKCGRLEKDSINFCSYCGGLLFINYIGKKKKFFTNSKIRTNNSIFEIFSPILPLEEKHKIVALQNFYTPLVYCDKISREYKCKVFAKLECLNVTNSIKDREAIIEVCKAKELGYKTIIAASTGNLAASLAAYSSKAGIKCKIYVPWNIPNTKITQIMKYGAIVKKEKKTYDQLADYVKKEALKKKYFLGGLQAFRCEGYRTVSYEIFIQLVSTLSKIIIPMGDGTTLTGIYRGFKELKDWGFIKRTPQIIGVQEQGIDPIINIFRGDKIVIMKKHKGVAKAINIMNPQDAYPAIAAIKESNGNCISVSSREIYDACDELAKKEGIYSEYASAATFAALKKMTQVGKTDSIVLAITGSGLKNQ